MHYADNGPTQDEIRLYGSHVGFAWALEGRRSGIGSAEAGQALQLAASVNESPLQELLAEDGDHEELMRCVAISIMDSDRRNAPDAVSRFWREVAAAAGMDNCDNIPHKPAFVRGFLDAQWILLNQDTYHDASDLFEIGNHTSH